MSTTLKTLDNLHNRTIALLDISNNLSASARTQISALLDTIVSAAENPDDLDGSELESLCEWCYEWESMITIRNSRRYAELCRQRDNVRECSK
jgi:hypothetical protein